MFLLMCNPGVIPREPSNRHRLPFHSDLGLTVVQWVETHKKGPSGCSQPPQLVIRYTRTPPSIGHPSLLIYFPSERHVVPKREYTRPGGRGGG